MLAIRCRASSCRLAAREGESVVIPGRGRRGQSVAERHRSDRRGKAVAKAVDEAAPLLASGIMQSAQLVAQEERSNEPPKLHQFFSPTLSSSSPSPPPPPVSYPCASASSPPPPVPIIQHPQPPGPAPSRVNAICPARRSLLVVSRERRGHELSGGVT